MFESMELGSFLLFLSLASLIAISPGPGILYVMARTLAGGRAEGIASSIGTGVGGMAHVIAGAFGVSALVMASAQAFTLLKMAGAAYLIWLGIKTMRQARVAVTVGDVAPAGSRKAFRDGIVVEVFNPKTAAFFLAFIPQFVDPDRGAVALQFVVLGCLSVMLNTLVDIVIAYGAAAVRNGIASRPRLLRRLREGSGVLLFGLGFSLAWARRPV
ncbi:MAG: LysE family translocator [Hyphomicrobiaceae bacterium]